MVNNTRAQIVLRDPVESVEGEGGWESDVDKEKKNKNQGIHVDLYNQGILYIYIYNCMFFVLYREE